MVIMMGSSVKMSEKIQAYSKKPSAEFKKT